MKQCVRYSTYSTEILWISKTTYQNHKSAETRKTTAGFKKFWYKQKYVVCPDIIISERKKPNASFLPNVNDT